MLSANERCLRELSKREFGGPDNTMEAYKLHPIFIQESLRQQHVPSVNVMWLQ